MAGINKGLKVDDRVVIVETADDRLDGTRGTVLGTSFNYIMKAHIVLLDRPYNGEKAISITEACLEKVAPHGGVDDFAEQGHLIEPNVPASSERYNGTDDGWSAG